MVDIASGFGGATSGLVYEIHQIATSVLCLIGEEHFIYAHDDMDHPSNLLCRPLQLGYILFKVEGKVVGELIDLHMRR